MSVSETSLAPGLVTVVTGATNSVPAFIAPPASLGVTAGIAAPLILSLADDAALALGPGADETLAVSLIASNGVFALATIPTGLDVIGTNSATLVLVGNAANIAAFDAALAGVSLNAAGNGTVQYIARQSGSSLPQQITSGSLTIAASGSLTATSAAWQGGAGNWQTGAQWSSGTAPDLASSVTIGSDATIGGAGVGGSLTLLAGTTLDVTGSVALAGSLSIAGVNADLMLDAGGALSAGGVVLQSGAWLTDFGALTLDGLDAIGVALLPGGATLNGPLAIAPGGTVDFVNVLQAGAAAPTTSVVAISLAANAVLAGAGTLIAGNFSQSDPLLGPGTVLALGPAPLTLDAGSIGGGVDLAIEPGAVLELAPVAPLSGVFNATTITVGSDATISFAPGASPAQNQGGFASPRGEQGGVLVIDNPLDFAATFTGFTAGDRIVLPTLTSLTVFNVSANSFLVSGIDQASHSEIITIHTSLAPGDLPVVETDQAGQAVIGMRAASASLTLNDTPANGAAIDATQFGGAGIGETIIGLGVLVPSDPSAALLLTITAERGALSLANSLALTTSLTLSASSALALDQALTGLIYLPAASGNGDSLNFTGGGGLGGLSAAIGVIIAPAATISFGGGTDAVFSAGSSWFGGTAPANGDVALLVTHQGAPILLTGPGEAGALDLQGGYDLAGSFVLPGVAGVALSVASSGFALFDANAVLTLGAGADITGGTLGLAGSLSAPGQTIAIDQGWLELTGSASAGAWVLGDTGTAQAGMSGSFTVASTTLGGNGSGGLALVTATGTADLNLGAISAPDATLALGGSAVLAASALDLTTGTLIDSQNATLVVSGAISLGAGASASIGPVASLSAISLINTGSLMDASAHATLSGGLSLQAGGSLTLEDGVLTLGTLNIAAGASLSGSGAISAVGGGLATLDNQGALLASGGVLAISAALQGDATIGDGATLDLAGSAQGGTISFAGSLGLLALSDASAQHDAVLGLTGSDAIDLLGIAPGSVQLSGGTVSLSGVAAFALSVAAGQAAVIGDGMGGSLITESGPMPCFARGTRLLTPNGYRAVENLQPGDAVVTARGQVRPIAWIGWRTLDLARSPASLRPVRIARDAFAPGVPRRDVFLSPLHAIAVADGLTPACLLVNDATITRDEQALAVTYFHIELASHDILLAEGLACESYRDSGNRARFAHGIGMAQGFAPACRPALLGGPALAAARRDLHRRAEAQGYRLCHDLPIQALAGSSVISGRMRRNRLHFAAAEPVDQLLLRMPTAMPAATDPASEDRRLLGFCAGKIRVDGQVVAGNLAAGWHERGPDDRGIWSGGWASIILPQAGQRIEINVLGRVPHWILPSHPALHSV